jgi:hypothetical protein
MKGSVLDKMKADFNSDKHDRCDTLDTLYLISCILKCRLPDVFSLFGRLGSMRPQFGLNSLRN